MYVNARVSGIGKLLRAYQESLLHTSQREYYHYEEITALTEMLLYYHNDTNNLLAF